MYKVLLPSFELLIYLWYLDEEAVVVLYKKVEQDTREGRREKHFFACTQKQYH